MFAFVLTIHFFISLILIAVVLMQSGRGAELGAAFGSVGQANSVRTPETFLSRFTTGLAVLFMITSLSLALLSSSKVNESVTDDIQIEAQVKTPAETPAETRETQSTQPE